MADLADLPWQGRGMLLLQGAPASVVSWAGRGLLPVHVVPLQGWTAVLPAGPSHARPPYDNTMKTLAGRPVPSRLRPAIGLFVLDGNAVVSAHRSGWRATRRWLVWAPGEGVLQPRQLAAGRPADLLAVSGSRDRTARRWIRELLVDGSGDASHLLAGLLELLALPGSDLLDGRRDPVATRGYALVEPAEHHVAMFEKIISDEARHRAELDED